MAVTAWTYILKCADDSFYIGWTNDLPRRLAAHNAGKGARYTRGRGPLRLLARREYPDRASASRAEWQLKRLPRARKLAFFAVDGESRTAGCTACLPNGG